MHPEYDELIAACKSGREMPLEGVRLDRETLLALYAAGFRDFRKVDLSRVDLSCVDLNHANLSHANLNGTNLSGANLIKACLRNATLHDALLVDANLSDTNCNSANFFRASLKGANLSGSNLGGAHLVETEFYGADLSRAQFRGADFRSLHASSFLSEAKIDLLALGQRPLSNATLDARSYKAFYALGVRDFRGAEFYRGADLSGCDFRDTKLSDLKIHFKSKRPLDKSTLDKNAFKAFQDLGIHDFSGAVFIGLDFRGIDLKNTNLEDFKIELSNMGERPFDKAKLDTNAYKAFYDLGVLDYRGADLSAVELTQLEVLRDEWLNGAIFSRYTALNVNRFIAKIGGAVIMPDAPIGALALQDHDNGELSIAVSDSGGLMANENSVIQPDSYPISKENDSFMARLMSRVLKWFH